ncbi:MAG: ATP-grasp domain-containing protein [Ignavibacteria bacterium]|jgi:D-alanine-D-alanine ligase
MKDISVMICVNDPVSIYDNYIGKDTSDVSQLTDLSEKEFFTNIEKVKEQLNFFFNDVSVVTIGNNIIKNIKEIKKISPGVIFNFVESIEGNTTFESYSAGMFDLIGISYTGNSSLCLGNCLNKVKTKEILTSHGIKTPNFIKYHQKQKFREDSFTLNFPVIIKLIKEDASIGISEFSVCKNFEELKNRIKYLGRNYNQDLIIEEYIKGREFNVSILSEEVLPLSEISFKGLPSRLPKIVTYEAKWSPESIYYKHTNPTCPAVIDDRLSERIKATAMKAFEAMNCRDYARVDIRINSRNVPYVIEVNPNPDISVDSGFARSAKAGGLEYGMLLKKIAEFALERNIYDYEYEAETYATG